MEFYQNNQVIFLTGGTGFVGKTLLEKILRSLPHVKKIYLLVRASDKTRLQSRVTEEIFSSRLFESLKTQFTDAQDFRDRIMSKVVPVQGDITLDHLGLSIEDMTMVQADTTVLINCAAAVSYFHPMREAINMNCHGPLRALKLARGMPGLKAIVHVSTSFVNTHFGPGVKELIYPYPLGNADQLFETLEEMSDEELLEYEQNIILKAFPNTYVASKSLAEHLIQSWSRSMGLPVVIVRPSIVTGSLSEPMPGWVEGMGGCNGITVLCAVGAVQGLIGYENLVLDLIPVDIVCKTILMAATQAKRNQQTVPIFHVGTSSHNPVTYNHVFCVLEQYWQQARQSTKNPKISNNVRAAIYSATDFDLQFHQRFTNELRLVRGGGHESLRKKLAQAYTTPKMFSTFCSNQWFWDVSNSIALDEGAPEALHSALKKGFNWDEYLQIYNMGLHEHILGERLEKMPAVKYIKKSIQRRFEQLDEEAKYSTALLSRL